MLLPLVINNYYNYYNYYYMYYWRHVHVRYRLCIPTGMLSSVRLSVVGLSSGASIPLTAMAQPFPLPFRSPFPPYPSIPSLPSPIPPALFHPLAFLSILPSLRNRPTNPLGGGAGGALQASPAGFGAEPQPKSNLVHFSFKIWHMVAAISLIFLRISLLNFVQFKEY